MRQPAAETVVVRWLADGRLGGVLRVWQRGKPKQRSGKSTAKQRRPPAAKAAATIQQQQPQEDGDVFKRLSSPSRKSRRRHRARQSELK